MKTRAKAPARGAKSTPARKIPKPKMKADKAWIVERIRDLDVSQRQFCFRYLTPIGMDPSMLSRVLNGERELSSKEAETIAEALRVPYAELMRHLGVNPDIGASGSVPVIGRLDARGELHVGRPAGTPHRVSLPSAAGGTLRAAIFQTPQRYMDGWIAFFNDRPTTTSGPRGARAIEPGAIGRMAVITMPDKRRYVRVLERGYERGKYNLCHLCPNDDPISGVEIVAATPVLWVKAGED